MVKNLSFVMLMSIICLAIADESAQQDAYEALNRAQFAPPTESEEILNEDPQNEIYQNVEEGQHDSAATNFLNMVRESTARDLKRIEEKQDLEIDGIVGIQQTNQNSPVPLDGQADVQKQPDYDAQVNPLQKQFSGY